MVLSLGNEKIEAWAWSLVSRLGVGIHLPSNPRGGWGTPCLALRAAQIPGLSHPEAMLCGATRKESTRTEGRGAGAGPAFPWGRDTAWCCPRRTEVPG